MSISDFAVKSKIFYILENRCNQNCFIVGEGVVMLQKSIVKSIVMACCLGIFLNNQGVSSEHKKIVYFTGGFGGAILVVMGLVKAKNAVERYKKIATFFECIVQQRNNKNSDCICAHKSFHTVLEQETQKKTYSALLLKYGSCIEIAAWWIAAGMGLYGAWHVGDLIISDEKREKTA